MIVFWYAIALIVLLGALLAAIFFADRHARIGSYPAEHDDGSKDFR